MLGIRRLLLRNASRVIPRASLVEQICVGTGADEGDLIPLDTVDQEPVGFDMALAEALQSPDSL